MLCIARGLSQWHRIHVLLLDQRLCDDRQGHARIGKYNCVDRRVQRRIGKAVDGVPHHCFTWHAAAARRRCIASAVGFGFISFQNFFISGAIITVVQNEMIVNQEQKKKRKFSPMSAGYEGVLTLHRRGWNEEVDDPANSLGLEMFRQ